MKWFAWAVRGILAALFLYFGLNLVFGFAAIPRPSGLAANFRDALAISGYIKAVGVLQAVGGALLLFDMTVALGLLILGPIIVNIAFYHIYFRIPGLPLVFLCAFCEIALLLLYRGRFSGLLKKEMSPCE